MILTSQRVYEYLCSEEAEHGARDVREGARRYMLKKTLAGEEPTIRRPIPRTWVVKLHGKQNGKCGRCHDEVLLSQATGDHIKPISAGGEHKIRNVRMVCSKCNSEKGSRDLIEDSKATGETVLQQLQHLNQEGEDS